MRAIPTKYKGRQYRSRLEARWACMLDLLDWPAEYEPFDLDGWIPDFALPAKRGAILVEVKPLTNFDENLAAELERQAQQYEKLRAVLLLGCVLPLDEMRGAALGWSWSRQSGWRTEYLQTEVSHRIFDICMDRHPGPFYGEMTGVLSNSDPHALVPCSRDTQTLWTAAGNAVQWRKPV